MNLSQRLCPFTIVSLWEVLQIDAANVLNAFSYLGSCIKHLEMGREELIARGVENPANISAEQLGDLMNCGKVLRNAAANLDMVASVSAADRYQERLDKVAEKTGAISINDMGQITALGSQMLAAFGDEMHARLMFVMPSKHASFYPDGAHFGEAVEEAFPTVAYDVAEAAKCRAVGRWTACVMHVMRVLETGLGALAGHFGVEADGNWNTILNQIESKAREVGKRTHGKEAEQWAAEAGTHLRFIKNAWRNHAMHPLEKYDEERAVAIFDNARSFMQHLATRLSE